MRLDCPCDLCGKTRGRDKRPWQHFVDMLDHHHHRCPDHWQVRCLACGAWPLPRPIICSPSTGGTS